MADQLESQAPQHALANDPSIDVNGVLEPAVDENKDEERTRERKQIVQLVEFVAEENFRKLAATDRLVDDGLRQIETEI